MPPHQSDRLILKELFQHTHGIALEERDSAWKPEEIRALDKVLAMLPAAFVSQNPNIKSIVKQQEYTGDYDGAPGHGMYQANAGPDSKKDYIVMYDKAFWDLNGQLKLGNIAKTLIHELAHSLEDEKPGPYREWLKLSGWFQEPNMGWLAGRDTGFLNGYSQKHPKEDFAESFTAYILDPDRLKAVSPLKYMFMERFFREQ